MENLESSSIDAIKRARLDTQAQTDPRVRKYVQHGLALILTSTAESAEAKIESLRAVAREIEVMVQELEGKTKSV